MKILLYFVCRKNQILEEMRKNIFINKHQLCVGWHFHNAYEWIYAKKKYRISYIICFQKLWVKSNWCSNKGNDIRAVSAYSICRWDDAEWKTNFHRCRLSIVILLIWVRKESTFRFLHFVVEPIPSQIHFPQVYFNQHSCGWLIFLSLFLLCFNNIDQSIFECSSISRHTINKLFFFFFSCGKKKKKKK